MSSTADEEEQRREQRLAHEQETSARARRTRRLWLFGASTVAALIVVAIAIALSQGGSDDGADKGLSGGEGLIGVEATEALFKGIPQSETTLGDPDAPLQLQEFADLQCPFCAEYTRNVLPTLVKRYVRTGQLSMDLRLLTFIGPDSEAAAGAAVAASRENRMWQFTDLFYENQGQENSGYVTPDYVRSIAGGSGVTPDEAVRGMQDDVGGPQLQRAQQSANAAGVDSTPSFLIGKPGGTMARLEVTQLTPDQFTSAIDKLLN